MAKLLQMSCPSCKSKLEIDPEFESFACVSCGNEFTLKRGGGVFYLSPLEDDTNYHKEPLNESFDENNLTNELSTSFAQNTEYSHDFSQENYSNFDTIPAVSSANDLIAEMHGKKLSLISKFKKTRKVIIILGFVLAAITYALLPNVDSYQELFVMLGWSMGSVVIITLLAIVLLSRNLNENLNSVDNYLKRGKTNKGSEL